MTHIDMGPVKLNLYVIQTMCVCFERQMNEFKLVFIN